MEFITTVLTNITAFVVILSVIVFVHEFGHYFIAKISGVKIEQFSIGFGKEMFGFNDKSGTRWKVCYLPLGGYVKMFGDIDPASAPDNEKIKAFTEEEKKVAFHTKSLPIKSAVVFAGPAANFLLSIVLLIFFYMIVGKPTVIPEISQVEEGSPAYEAGLKPGDVIKEIDGTSVETYEDMHLIVAINTGTPLELKYERDGQQLQATMTPVFVESSDMFGNEIQAPSLGIVPTRKERVIPKITHIGDDSAALEAGLQIGDMIKKIDDVQINTFSDIVRVVQSNQGVPIEITYERDGQLETTTATLKYREVKNKEGETVKVPLLGIGASEVDYNKLGFVESFSASLDTTYNLTVGTLKAVGQMITGERSPKDISGPIGIAKYSGQSAQQGIKTVIWFIVVLSINLGLVNLFPIPLLDGGHLLYYAVEAVRGKPLADKVQQAGFKIGIALVGALFIFAIINDLMKFF